MRFLKDDEIPETERERRAGIRQSMQNYQDIIDAENARMKPHLDRLVTTDPKGYQRLVDSIDARLRGVLWEMSAFRRMLPPFVEYRMDGILEQVPITPELLAKAKKMDAK